MTGLLTEIAARKRRTWEAYETASAVRTGLASYIKFYNTRRPHSAHRGRTPQEVYYATLPTSRLAA